MIEVWANREQVWGNSGVELRILDNDGTHRAHVERVTFESHERGEMIPAAVLLRPAEAQKLMDSLWHCGLRPTEGHGSVGQLGATERHLADMKQIALHALKIKEKGKE